MLRRRRNEVGRARRLLTSSMSMGLLTACACGGYDDCTPLFGTGGGPPPESSRTLAFEDGRTYEKGVRHYDVDLQQW